ADVAEPLPSRPTLATDITWSGAPNGSGASRTPLTTENTAVIAPMARASVKVATIKKPGARVRCRAAYRTSLQMAVMKSQKREYGWRAADRRSPLEETCHGQRRASRCQQSGYLCRMT